MKNIFCILFLLLTTNIYSQNVIQLIRNLNTPVICRTIRTNIQLNDIALRAIENQKLNYTFQTNCYVELQLKKLITIKYLKNPMTIYGPYNYMRKISSIANFDYNLEQWRNINNTTGYNGVHHLIMKSTIKMIYQDLKKTNPRVSLIELENNCPSIFHPMHGNPRFKHIFHNPEQQYEQYKKFGMKITILSRLNEIDLVNQLIGQPHLSKEYIEGILKEAELWSKHNGLKW